MRNESNYLRHCRRRLSYPVIRAAALGDLTAMQKILEHFENHIVRLSTRVMYDEYGHAHYYVDEEFRRRLERKLIAKVLQLQLQG